MSDQRHHRLFRPEIAAPESHRWKDFQHRAPNNTQFLLCHLVQRNPLGVQTALPQSRFRRFVVLY